MSIQDKPHGDAMITIKKHMGKNLVTVGYLNYEHLPHIDGYIEELLAKPGYILAYGCRDIYAINYRKELLHAVGYINGFYDELFGLFRNNSDAARLFNDLDERGYYVLAWIPDLKKGCSNKYVYRLIEPW